LRSGGIGRKNIKSAIEKSTRSALLFCNAINRSHVQHLANTIIPMLRRINRLSSSCIGAIILRQYGSAALLMFR